jgi:hypothetical protein
MISRIPTPNAAVDTSWWPIVRVTLSAAPGNDEVRLTLGRLRALRVRLATHVVIVDTRQLDGALNGEVMQHIASFVYESTSMHDAGAAEVVVIATQQPVRAQFAELGSAFGCVVPIRVVGGMRSAFGSAVAALRCLPMALGSGSRNAS